MKCYNERDRYIKQNFRKKDPVANEDGSKLYYPVIKTEQGSREVAVLVGRDDDLIQVMKRLYPNTAYSVRC